MNHSFDVDVAVEHGVHAAVLYETIKFWVLKNKANGKHFHEGRHWTYNSAKAFTELFPYLSADQIQRALKRLEEAEMLVTGRFNASPYDRTRWYSTTEGCVTDSAELRNEFPQNCGMTSRNVAAPIPVQPSNHTVQTSSTPKAPKGARFDPLTINLPDAVSQQAWGEWIAYRKTRKLSTTEQTARAQLKKLTDWAAQGHKPAQIIADSIANGWQGLFEPKAGKARASKIVTDLSTMNYDRAPDDFSF